MLTEVCWVDDVIKFKELSVTITEAVDIDNPVVCIIDGKKNEPAVLLNEVIEGNTDGLGFVDIITKD